MTRSVIPPATRTGTAYELAMRVPIHGVERLALFRPDRWPPIETVSAAPIFQAIAEVSSMDSPAFSV
jgi:hypothetical protein